MKIIYKTGSILEKTHKKILLGVNAAGKLDTVVNNIVGNEYPFFKAQYLERCIERQVRLGELLFVKCRSHQILLACIKPNPQSPIDYGAFSNCIQAIEDTFWGSTFAMPMIGTGIDKGNWDITKSIVEKNLETVQPIVYLNKEYQIQLVK